MARRLLGFTSLPLVASIAPILVLPIVARASDPGEWTAILTAQAVGAWLATIVLFGESVQGPAAIAGAKDFESASAYYAASLRARLTLSALLTIPLAGAALVAAGSSRELFVFTVVLLTSSLNGLAYSWSAVGLGQPGLIARYDTLPRVGSVFVSAVCIVLGGDVVLFALIPAGVLIASLAIYSQRVMGVALRDFRPRWQALRYYVTGRDVGLYAIAGSLYANVPLPIAGVAGAPGRAGLASADKIFRYASFAISATGNSLQAWVVSGGGDFRRRQRFAIVIHGVLGVTGGLMLACLGPWLSSLLFGATHSARALACGGYALCFLALSLSTPLVRNEIVPRGRARVAVRATFLSASLGIPITALLAYSIGADAIPYGLAVSEFATLLIFWRAASRMRRDNA